MKTEHRVVEDERRRRERPEERHLERRRHEPREESRVLHRSYVRRITVGDRVEVEGPGPRGGGRDALEDAELHQVVGHEAGEEDLPDAEDGRQGECKAEWTSHTRDV